MQQLPFNEIVAQAHDEAGRQRAFDAFEQRLQGALAGAWIGAGEAPQTLSAYLRAVMPGATGDEAAVTDELTRRLLSALGYEGAHIAYNQRVATDQERAVPDFTVRIHEVRGKTPVFLVEDKATAIRDFRAPRAGGESALQQLRRYVLGSGIGGRLGLLCNGWTLEGWEFGGDGDACLVRLDLEALAAAAALGQAFPSAARSGLRTLWSRFSHESFLAAHALSTGAFAVPKPDAAWTERLQAVLASGAGAGGIEEVMLAYHEEVWRARARDVRVAKGELVEGLQSLIEGLTDDVRHQLDDALARTGEHDRLLRQEQERTDLPRLRQALGLTLGHFDLTAEVAERKLWAPLENWARQPNPHEIPALVAYLAEGLMEHVRTGASVRHHQESMLGEATVREVDDGRSRRKNARAAIEGALQVYATATAEYVAVRDGLSSEYRGALRAQRAFEIWKRSVSSSVLVNAADDSLRAEFARQTAYVYVVRLLMVRICEDKGLFRRKLSDGGVALWEDRAAQYLDFAAGRSYDYLTRMAYECAQNIYLHFYEASELFDWYRLDDKALLRALVILNGFNLEHIDTDVIGEVYGQYLEAGKHEQGRYYTPAPLVTTMLDRLGYNGRAVVGRRIADLACGSGSFLVEACRRLLAQFRDADGNIPKENIVPAVTAAQRCLFGLDINPFACYLAETNLLIQVLDLVRQARDEDIPLTIERFGIYCEDSLRVDELVANAPDEVARLVGKDEVVPELIKARSGAFRDGFHFLVGNPPYVRADEPGEAWQSYRRELETQRWFTTGHLKWDLYVPFVEQYHRLLAEGPDARCCLITIESLETAPYASKLRERLHRDATIHEVVFTEGLRLFPDAAWQNNVVLTFSRGAPPAEHSVRRLRSDRLGPDGRPVLEALDVLVQAETPPERLFRRRAAVALDLSNIVRWDEICYVSKGMVLHSNERLADGQEVLVPASYDPARFGEALVQDMGSDGKRIRHRAFKRDELVASDRDDVHTRPCIGSREVLRGGIGRVYWLEYGPHARCPARVSRPTFPELYDRPKVMFGAFTGVAVDDGTAMGEGFLVTPHTVRLSIRWALLEGVSNRSLDDERSALREADRYDPALSTSFSEWYLCALALSEPIQKWFAAEKRSMKDDVYPDDIRAIPVKRLSPPDQVPFIERARERHSLLAELQTDAAAGFGLDEPFPAPTRKLTLEHPIMQEVSATCSLGRAVPRGLFEFVADFRGVDLRRARAVGAEVRLGRHLLARPGDSIPAEHRPAVAEFLAAYLAELPGTFDDRGETDRFPATPDGLVALATSVAERRARVRTRVARLAAIEAELNELAWALYRPKIAPSATE